MLPTRINWNTVSCQKNKIGKIHSFLNIYLKKDFGIKIECSRDNMVSLAWSEDIWDFDDGNYDIKPKVDEIV